MIKHLLFDLDDTLYASAAVMHEISSRMSLYMRMRIGIPEAEVDELRQLYWRQYGTTLRGLHIERHIDAQDFLAFVHDVPVEQYLQADAALDAMLAQLSPQKFIFTNASTEHARRVLTALGIEKHFARIFDINFIEYESKPTPSAYDKVLAALGASGAECLMIDDAVRNLVPAKQLGMRTVLIDGKSAGPEDQLPEGVDHVIKTIYEVTQLMQ